MTIYDGDPSPNLIPILYLLLLAWAWLSLLFVNGLQPESTSPEGGCSSPETLRRVSRISSLAVAYLSLAVIAVFLITFLVARLAGLPWAATP